MHCIPIKIECDKDFFWQWDLNKRLVLGTDRTDIQVHFDAGSNEALAVDVYKENGKVYANIPNILLQEYGRIKCWVYDPGNEATTLQVFYFTVAERDRPPDYVYTETETLTWHELEKRIAELEENGVGGGGEFLVTVEWDGSNQASSETTVAEIREAYEKGLTPVCQVYLDDYQGYFRMPMITADGLGNGVVAFSGILFYTQIIFGFFDGGVSVETIPTTDPDMLPNELPTPNWLIIDNVSTKIYPDTAYFDGSKEVRFALPVTFIITIQVDDNGRYYTDHTRGDIDKILFDRGYVYCELESSRYVSNHDIYLPFVWNRFEGNDYVEYYFRGRYRNQLGKDEDLTVKIAYTSGGNSSVTVDSRVVSEGGADIEEIVQAVIDALPVYDGEVVEV